MLCTIELDRSRPIADAPSSASFVRDIEDWSRICGNLYLWDYTVNFSHHVSPFPNLHVLQPNIRFFVGHGVRKHFQQTNTGPGHESSELKSAILARLLWDPEADVDAWTADFLEGYYGRAGKFILRYIEALTAALARTGARLDIYEPPAVHAGDYLSAADVARCDTLFDRAEAAAAGDPERLVRVRTARLPLMYAKLEIGKADMFGPRGFYREKDGRFAPNPGMTRLVEDFYRTVQSRRRPDTERIGPRARGLSRRCQAVHRRPGRGQPGLPPAGRGRPAPVAEVLPRRSRHIDERRPRRRRFQGPLAGLGRRGRRR